MEYDPASFPIKKPKSIPTNPPLMMELKEVSLCSALGIVPRPDFLAFGTITRIAMVVTV